MCRLYGLKAKSKETIHNSMIAAENALLHQSGSHSDGWGLAYYQQNCPHLIKSPASAFEDHLFARLSQRVASDTVIAHLRKSTMGCVAATNTHPFQYGRWIFAHNGNVRHFIKWQPEISRAICEPFRQYRLGDTDSELIFYFLLARLEQKQLLDLPAGATAAVVAELATGLKDLQKIIGPHSVVDGDPDQTYLSFLLTNGEFFFAYQGGKCLYYNLGTDLRAMRSKNPAHGRSGTQVDKVEVSSEPTDTHGYWRALKPGECVFVDKTMNFTVARIG